MRRSLAIIGVFGLLAVGVTGWITADEKSSGRPQDEAAIRAASQAFATAFEKGDAAAVGALFTDEAEYVEDGGDRIQGRAAIAKAYGEFFGQRKEVKAETKTDAIRFLGRDAAIEEGTFTVKAKDSPAHASRFSAFYVRQDGKWLMALLKEWGDATTDAPDLDDLKWLIGTWESDGSELTAKTTYEWAPNKKFIIAHYTVTPKKAGEKPNTGTQVIGVNPASGMIHAWVFDSEGGIGESSWSWDGQRWAIDSSATLSDGSTSTALNFLARDGDNAFTWRSVQRTHNGVALPDLGTVKVKRVGGGK